MMKITITMQWLIFDDPANEEVLQHVKDHALYHLVKGGKLHVKGTADDLFYMLNVLSQDNDIDLI